MWRKNWSEIYKQFVLTWWEFSHYSFTHKLSETACFLYTLGVGGCFWRKKKVDIQCFIYNSSFKARLSSFLSSWDMQPAKHTVFCKLILSEMFVACLFASNNENLYLILLHLVFWTHLGAVLNGSCQNLIFAVNFAYLKIHWNAFCMLWRQGLSFYK